MAMSVSGETGGNNHNLLQDTNDSKPKTGLSSHNGMNVVSFDGNDFLRRNYSNVLNTNLTCFIVARVDTGGIDAGGDAILFMAMVGMVAGDSCRNCEFL